MLTSRQRVLNALAYKGCDRLPTFYQATPEFDAELKQYVGVSDAQAGDLTPDDALDAVLGVDMKDIGPRYIGPELRRFPDGSWEGVFGERYNNIPYELGTYPEAVYLPYAGIDDVAELDTLRFPTADWHDYSTLAEQCARWPDHAIVFGGAGIPDFMNGIARCRGVEQVLLDVGTRDPVYLKLIEKRHEYFLGYCEAALRAAGGRIDILALGEDYGSQRGLLISPRTFDRLFRPYHAAILRPGPQVRRAGDDA